MSDTTAIEARISGRVQGVSFRAWTEAEARARGLSGWVRNEADGTVSAHLAGPADKVSDMVEALHRGPAAARVEAVRTSPAKATAKGKFRIIR
ncbi:acylphosphatase [Roseovarius sp. TE539]|uniref:acylphosphatase n=1 Tax=Roseovarius sp. TE539 TaxID=2249812 RepID=UPI000DDCC0A3|nr:acylphosphatase [Roseovarius sp. TE539]RBI75684.1 acylphosphatase [Roseovarius sp. TE539]